MLRRIPKRGGVSFQTEKPDLDHGIKFGFLGDFPADWDRFLNVFDFDPGIMTIPTIESRHRIPEPVVGLI